MSDVVKMFRSLRDLLLIKYSDDDAVSGKNFLSRIRRRLNDYRD